MFIACITLYKGDREFEITKVEHGKEFVPPKRCIASTWGPYREIMARVKFITLNFEIKEDDLPLILRDAQTEATRNWTAALEAVEAVQKAAKKAKIRFALKRYCLVTAMKAREAREASALKKLQEQLILWVELMTRPVVKRGPPWHRRK
jgi:hypothetical protein